MTERHERLVSHRKLSRLIAQAPAMLTLLRTLAESHYAADVDDVNTGHNASYRDMARDLLCAVEEGGGDRSQGRIVGLSQEHRRRLARQHQADKQKRA